MRSVTFCCCKDENLDEDAILYLRLINMTAVSVAFRYCSKYYNPFCISFAISECEMHSFVSSTSWIVSDFSSESHVNPSQATENHPSAATSFVSSPPWISFQRWKTYRISFTWSRLLMEKSFGHNPFCVFCNISRCPSLWKLQSYIFLHANFVFAY